MNTDGPPKRLPNWQPIEPDSPLYASIMVRQIGLYRSYVTQREFQPAYQQVNFDRFARDARVKWREWQGEDSLHEMAFGEPYHWTDHLGVPLFSAPLLDEIPCPFCERSIPPIEHYLAYPTIHCWNCGHTFAAPDSWRDWKPEPGFIARMEDDAAQRDAERLYGPSTVAPVVNSREIPHGRSRIKRILFTQISPLDGSILFAILLALATMVATIISTASRR
jgi:hypothetical protein